MLTESDKNQLLELEGSLSRDITIGLVDSEHPSGGEFRKFCDEIIRLVPKIKLYKEAGSVQHPPQILVGSRLRYQALPGGLEMRPFIEALSALESGPAELPASIREVLEKNSLPATLTVFMAPQCTYCPTAISRLIPLAMADAGIQLIIVDGTLFPEAAKKHKIQSVPTVLLEDQFRWTGSVPVDEIVETICTRNPAKLGAPSLEGIIKDGQAGHLAAMMLEAREVFPAFFDLVSHDQWSIRLGAMVVMEEIAAKRPEVAAVAVEPLWDRFEGVSDQIKGDILYLFGEIGDRRAVPWLKAVLDDPYDEEVKEAAREALEKLA